MPRLAAVLLALLWAGTTSRGTTWNRVAEMLASMAGLALVALPDTRLDAVLVA